MPKKISDDTATQKTLRMLLLLLQSSEPMSRKKLSELLGYDKSTTFRIIRTLSSISGVELVEDARDREYFFSIGNRKSIPKLCFTAEGLQDLAMLRDWLPLHMPGDMQRRVEETLQRAGTFLPEDAKFDGLKSNAAAQVKGSIDYSVFGTQLKTLMSAIRQGLCCEVTYKAVANNAPKTYCFAPKLLVAYHEALYAHGWVVTDKGRPRARHDKPTPLAVQRIHSIVLEQRTTGHLPEISDDGDEGFGMMAATPEDVTIHFAANVADYVRERRWSKGQRLEERADGSVCLTMRIRNRPEFIAWALSFGKLAEVVAPADLRQEMADQARAMLALYEPASS